MSFNIIGTDHDRGQFQCRCEGQLPSCYCNLHSSTVNKLYVDGGCGVGDLVAVAGALMLLLLPSRSGPTATGGPPVAVAVAVGGVVLLMTG